MHCGISRFWICKVSINTYLGSGVDLVQIVDELGEILDGVDVVVGRR